MNIPKLNDGEIYIGGELPDRVESALLFAHVKDQFDQKWYWTRTQHAAYSNRAWCKGVKTHWIKGVE